MKKVKSPAILKKETKLAVTFVGYETLIDYP